MSNENKDYLNDSKQHILSQLEFLPEGWYVKLIPDMVDELVSVLGPHVEDFEVAQCKEKFGMLRVYWHLKNNDDNTLRSEVSSIIRKYEDMSAEICVDCGAPATHTVGPWILYVCDSCDKSI